MYRAEPGGSTDRPGVGVGVVVTDGDLRLLVRRRQPAAGCWAAPGGYLERGESFAACAERETREETGVEIADVEVRGVTNDLLPDGTHNVTVWLSARAIGGDARVLAPEEVDEVGWFPREALPRPLDCSLAAHLSGRSHPVIEEATGLISTPASDAPVAG
jgi:8-oxo-dGTP diphosphatase